MNERFVRSWKGKEAVASVAYYVRPTFALLFLALAGVEVLPGCGRRSDGSSDEPSPSAAPAVIFDDCASRSTNGQRPRLVVRDSNAVDLHVDQSGIYWTRFHDGKRTAPGWA